MAQWQKSFKQPPKTQAELRAMLYAVSEKDDPTRVKVFEIYRDRKAYEAHLASDHFMKYKTTVATMVKSLSLVQTTPIALGAKSE